MRKLILSIVCLCVMAAVAGSADEEALPDLSSVKDPFLMPFSPSVKPVVENPVVGNPVVAPRAVAMPGSGIPQVPAILPKAALPPLRVQGIIWGGDKPSAIINDTVVEVGDTVNGVVVKSIQKGGINVAFQGENFNVRMDQ